MKNKHVHIIMISFALLSLAIVVAAMLIRNNKPNPAAVPINQIPLATVFTEASNNANFVQISLFGIEKFSKNSVMGNGRIRYSDGKNIFGYNGGKHGAIVTAVFEDTSSGAYQACAEVIAQPVSVGRELFISGEGTSQTSPPNAMGGFANVRFKKITECGVISSVHRK